MQRPESQKDLKFRDYLAVRCAIREQNKNPRELDTQTIDSILAVFYEEYPEYKQWDREE